MNKTEHMLAILEAKAKGRTLEVRSINHDQDGAAMPNWTPVTRDDIWLDFQHYEVRIAPVNTECWLVYDHDTGEYLDVVFANGAEAADWIIISLTDFPDATGGRYAPVRMIPHHAP
jgi:hypothetical protein